MTLRRRHLVKLLAWLVDLSVLAAGLAPGVFAGELLTNRFEMPIGQTFEQGMGAFSVQLNESGTAAVLYNVALVEDDGPGIKPDVKWITSVEDRAPIEEVGGDVWIKKILSLERPQASEARLYGSQGFQIRCNGQAIPLEPRTRVPHVPPELLRQGDNEFVLSSASKRNLSIARRRDILDNDPSYAGRPQRSFVSTNAGVTWTPIEGEYLLRLQLTQYAASGQLLSPVFDLGKGTGEDLIFQPKVRIQRVALKPAAETPAETRIDLAIRTGSTPVPETSSWTDWNTNCDAIPDGHRYLEWRATLSTANPLVTPALKSVAVLATVVREPDPDWAGHVRLEEMHNESIRYTSIPFSYENPLNPRLVALRKKYQLDAVVSSGNTELERLVLLRAWVGRALRYVPPAGQYPPWDADAILTGKTGFCVQFALTYLQCALSLGYQARYVFGDHPGSVRSTGHEVVEVWSDEYRKWILMDPNQMVHHVDPQTGIPYNLEELHQLLLETYYGDRVAYWTNAPKTLRSSPKIATCYGNQFQPVKPDPRKQEFGGEGDQYWVPTRWLFLRYLPRNDFYGQPHPIPQSQGLTWDWPDYWFLVDAQTPRDDLGHRFFTKRVSDLNWTLNQVRFTADYAELPCEIRIQMGTFTPYLDSYMCRFDTGAWSKSLANFAWKLHPGENRLEMRTRNNADVLGPISSLAVNYH